MTSGLEVLRTIYIGSASLQDHGTHSKISLLRLSIVKMFGWGGGIGGKSTQIVAYRRNISCLFVPRTFQRLLPSEQLYNEAIHAGESHPNLALHGMAHSPCSMQAYT